MSSEGTMKLISVNVGLPREVTWGGETITTGIFKSPVEGPVALLRHNLAGDGQANLEAHGGRDKAVYAYAAKHYAWWAAEIPGIELPWGAFGENLTVDGADESRVLIGDRYGVGSAEVVVTQPRLPCRKLGARFARDDMERRFADSGRSGFYLAVAREGAVEAGDTLTLLFRPDETMSVSDVFALRVGTLNDGDRLRRAARLEALPAGFRQSFQQRLERRDA